MFHILKPKFPHFPSRSSEVDLMYLVFYVNFSFIKLHKNKKSSIILIGIPLSYVLTQIKILSFFNL